MTRSTQQTDRQASALSRTMLWLSVILLFGGILSSAAQPGIAGSRDEISLHQIHNRHDSYWAEPCVALAADDQEDITAPGQDMVEAGDGMGPSPAIRLWGASHQLALGLLAHPVFADRPEAGAKHARAPPSMLFA